MTGLAMADPRRLERLAFAFGGRFRGIAASFRELLAYDAGGRSVRPIRRITVIHTRGRLWRLQCLLAVPAPPAGRQSVWHSLASNRVIFVRRDGRLAGGIYVSGRCSIRVSPLLSPSQRSSPNTTGIVSSSIIITRVEGLDVRWREKGRVDAAFMKLWNDKNVIVIGRRAHAYAPLPA
jgi:hypothetical protein